MIEHLELPWNATVIGVGATLFMDVWAVLQNRLLRTRSLDYALLGRWLGHLVLGTFRHEGIARAQQITAERAIGWAAHYLIGISFAALLLGIWGVRWASEPSLGPALIVGMATIVFPWLVLQPAFGAGVAASRMPQPDVARLRSIVTHASFGLGLYLAAWVVAAFSSVFLT
jgi:hypothetical protein